MAYQKARIVFCFKDKIRCVQVAQVTSGNMPISNVKYIIGTMMDEGSWKTSFVLGYSLQQVLGKNQTTHAGYYLKSGAKLKTTAGYNLKIKLPLTVFSTFGMAALSV